MTHSLAASKVLIDPRTELLARYGWLFVDTYDKIRQPDGAVTGGRP